MTRDGQNDAKTHECGKERRLAERPADATTAVPVREVREVFRLGKRTYPVWTEAMVKAREPYRRKKQRWYLLYDKVYDQRNLKEAWNQVEENGGAPGVSGETIERVKEELPVRLPRLQEALKEQKHRPRPIRRKLIPKGDGSGKMRELGIPEVEDRWVQAAVVRVIEPIFEDKFLDVSFGFRPERSAHQALERVDAAIRGERPFVVDGDIRNCFGSIPYQPLMEEVAREISDPKLLKLVEGFVKADIMEETKRWSPERGTPQGAVLSPLLANIYLHQFDEGMTRAGYALVRYADDFVVLCRTFEEAQAARSEAERILKEMGLELHPEKTRVVDARKDSFQFLGYRFWPGGREPRESSMEKLRDRIRAKTPRNSGVSLRTTIGRLNPTLKGWYAYFKHSFWNVFPDVDGFVRRRLRSICRKFEKRRGAARNKSDNIRYPSQRFHQLELFSLAEAHRRDGGGKKLIDFPALA